MTKKELRKVYREKRNELTATQRSRLNDLLLIQFQKAEIPFIHTLFSYWPIIENNEPDTHLFTDYLLFVNPGLIIAYPKSDFNTSEMTAVVITEETPFFKNRLNINEPDAATILPANEIDIVFVPLLAIDKKGYRVGYGKGFYDRFLLKCRNDCLKIGFSYFDPVIEITDTGLFDVPLNLCITPETVYVF